MKPVLSDFSITLCSCSLVSLSLPAPELQMGQDSVGYPSHANCTLPCPFLGFQQYSHAAGAQICIFSSDMSRPSSPFGFFIGLQTPGCAECSASHTWPFSLVSPLLGITACYEVLDCDLTPNRVSVLRLRDRQAEGTTEQRNPGKWQWGGLPWIYPQGGYLYCCPSLPPSLHTWLHVSFVAPLELWAFIHVCPCQRQEYLSRCCLFTLLPLSDYELLGDRNPVDPDPHSCRMEEGELKFPALGFSLSLDSNPHVMTRTEETQSLIHACTHGA